MIWYEPGIEQQIEDGFLRKIKQNAKLTDFVRGKERYVTGNGVFFGSRYVPYLSGIIPISDETTIALGIASLYGRAGVIARDRMLDEKQILTEEYRLFHQGFVNGIDNLFDVSKEPGIKDRKVEWQTELQKAMTESDLANQKEQALHRDNGCREVNLYTLKDIALLGRKTSLIQIPPKVVGLLTNRVMDGKYLAKAMDSLIVAIQLCDDLADIREDLESGFYSAPCATTMRLDKKRGKEDAIRNLFLPGTFECFLLLANYKVNEAKDIVTTKLNGGRSKMVTYFDQLSSYLEHIRTEVATYRQGLKLHPINHMNFNQLSPVENVEIDLDQLLSFLERVEPERISPVSLEIREK